MKYSSNAVKANTLKNVRNCKESERLRSRQTKHFLCQINDNAQTKHTRPKLPAQWHHCVKKHTTEIFADFGYGICRTNTYFSKTPPVKTTLLSDIKILQAQKTNSVILCQHYLVWSQYIFILNNKAFVKWTIPELSAFKKKKILSWPW